MDFTREPIIETIITPKEGCKLAIRNSKSGQEEFFVDAVEIVCFGHSLFFRSLEKPKPFLVPVADYEVLEVKEARLVLKHAGPEKAIKIGGGREPVKPPKETEKTTEKIAEESPEVPSTPVAVEASEGQLERRRDRRRPSRKRKQRDEVASESEETPSVEKAEELAETLADTQPIPPPSPAALQALLAPPPMLISETIGKYRQDNAFKNAFFLTQDEYTPHSKVEELLQDDELPLPPIPNIGEREEPRFSLETEAAEPAEIENHENPAPVPTNHSEESTHKDEPEAPKL